MHLNMIEKAFKKPKNKKWYSSWWGILILVLLGLFLSGSVASGIFIFTISSKLKLGDITLEKLFGKKYTASHAETLYGINSPAIGDESAPIAMVVFIDFASQKSNEAAQAVNKVMLDDYYKKQARFIFRHYPDIKNPVSIAASLASECAHEQGRFFEMYNSIFNESDISQVSFTKLAQASGLDSAQFDKCFQEEQNLFRIDRDMKDAQYLGVLSAPTFLINDKIVEGVPREEDIKKAIDLLIIQK